MIKVNFITGHSSGRGIGIYANRLAQALADTGEIKFTDKNPHIIHYPFFDLFYRTLPLFHSVPVVTTVHDLTPLILKNLYPVGIKGKVNLFYQKLALQQSKAILTDSHNSKQDIADIFGINQNKIFVTPLGVNPDYYLPCSKQQLATVTKRYHLPKKFILTVAGGPNPNKNLPFLASVTQKLNLPLVIVGRGVAQPLPPSPIHPELRDLQRLSNFTHLLLPGFISDVDMPAFYQLATAYVQASLYEGFGLPLLEAMASGCLIVSANTSSLPEIYPPQAITFDPKDSDSALRALNHALSLSASARKKLITRCQLRSRDFTWRQTADLTLSVYRQVIT